MITTLTIVRYRGIYTPFGFLSMAILRIPLILGCGPKFWKLMGCGKNGTFDINPDWHQWAFMANWDSSEEADKYFARSFISKYWSIFAKETWTIHAKSFESQGKWDGEAVFVKNQEKTEGKLIGILTRATIRLSKAKDFWENVPAVAKTISSSPGFVTSVGIGEVPFLRQATFSVWKNIDSVKSFAYRKKEHADVIKKTRQRDWYSEELFARFVILKSEGTLLGKDPLKGFHPS